MKATKATICKKNIPEESLLLLRRQSITKSLLINKETMQTSNGANSETINKCKLNYGHRQLLHYA